LLQLLLAFFIGDALGYALLRVGDVVAPLVAA